MRQFSDATFTHLMAIWELLNQKHEHFQKKTPKKPQLKLREGDDAMADDKKAAGSL